MTDYTKSVNFATKDALITGDPLKVVKGTEINTELDNLATSIATKFDKAGGTITGATSIAAALTSTSLLNLARGSIVQHATTMDLWALPNTLDGTGSAVTITAIINAPQAGPMRRFYGIAGTIWTNNAMFAVDGGTFTFVAGDYVDVETVTTATYKVHPFKADGTAVFNAGRQIQPITATAAAGALTITLLPTTLDYRSTTLTSGTVTTVTNAASLSTVISSGSTAGGTSAVALRLVILAINNAGVSEIAWTNLAGGINLDEAGVITTVAEGGAGAADSANVIYSTTARTGVAYRVVGFSDITNTTAGTWLTPTLTQGAGGQSLQQINKIITSPTVASTSGTSIDFTGIPAWVKRITVMLTNVSTNGITSLMVQLGDSGGIEVTGYLGAESTAVGATAAQNSTGFNIKTGIAAANIFTGVVTLVLLDFSTNTWAQSGNIATSNSTQVGVSAGSKALSAALDRIRITTANGTDLFDAGSISILVE